MKSGFGIDDTYKIINLSETLEDFTSCEGYIFSNGESFIIYNFETVILVETITDLMDWYSIDKEDRELFRKEIIESFKK